MRGGLRETVPDSDGELRWLRALVHCWPVLFQDTASPERERERGGESRSAYTPFQQKKTCPYLYAIRMSLHLKRKDKNNHYSESVSKYRSR